MKLTSEGFSEESRQQINHCTVLDHGVDHTTNGETINALLAN